MFRMMKLYRVIKVGSSYSNEKYIVAISKAEAIRKYYETTYIDDHWNVRAKFLCERKDIIPTIDPLKEKF